ncbi:hypothetical protein D3C83_54660 [compost metagenome]
MNFVGDAAPPEPWGETLRNITSRSGSGYGNGSRITVLRTEKIAVFAPIPRASAVTAANVNPGVLRRRRRAWRRS